METIAQIEYNQDDMAKSLLSQSDKPKFDFAKFCLAVRAEARLTQAEMAKQLGVSLRSYQKWESDKPFSGYERVTEPNPQAVIQILKLRASLRGINLHAFFDNLADNI